VIKGEVVTVFASASEALSRTPIRERQSGVDEGVTTQPPDRRVIPTKSGFLAMTKRPLAGLIAMKK